MSSKSSHPLRYYYISNIIFKRILDLHSKDFCKRITRASRDFWYFKLKLREPTQIKLKRWFDTSRNTIALL